MSGNDAGEAHLTPPPPGGALTYVRQAWLVLVLAVVFGAGLAGVQRWLGPIIAENRREEARAQVPDLVPGAERGAFVRDADGAIARIAGHRVLRALAGERLVGWVVIGRGQGFADAIELLVGVDPRAERITGMYVLDQKETPGLGDEIRSPGFRAQFADGHHGAMTTGVPLRAITRGEPGGNEIAAISGATISSRSVCGIIGETLDGELCRALRARAADGAEGNDDGE